MLLNTDNSNTTSATRNNHNNNKMTSCDSPQEHQFCPAQH